eukprot:861237-Amphidinium_carterae.1
MDATQRARQRRIATTSPSPWRGSMLVYAWGATLELWMDTIISLSTRCAQVASAGDASTPAPAPAAPAPAPPYSCPVDPVIPIESESWFCNVDDEVREECGWLGIDEETCAGRGCCWRPTGEVDGPIPWCFCATGSTSTET